MKNFTSLLLTILHLIFSSPFFISQEVTAGTKIIVAYVTSWSEVMPDPSFVTHINYAFAHVTDTYDGVRIDKEERLKSIVALRQKSPELKVMLSIGGWGSGGFSEMAADPDKRGRFAKDCRRMIDLFGLDGIDIDWEYPGSNAAGISFSPQDGDNFTLLMQDIRAAIGQDKLLTLASAAGTIYTDFPAILPVIDFVNVMAYDMGTPPYLHSALYPSSRVRSMTADRAVQIHREAGIPVSKLVLGMPFYGRGGGPLSSFVDYKEIENLTGYNQQWDDEAKVPYLTDTTGVLVCGYENPASLALKCRYIVEKELLGGMYWEYNGDNEAGDLRTTVYRELKPDIQQ